MTRRSPASTNIPTLICFPVCVSLHGIPYLSVNAKDLTVIISVVIQYEYGTVRYRHEARTMARNSVTYDQVAAIANALYAAGNKEPGTKVIRDELAKRAGPGMPIGSPNTVQKHLCVWREKARPIDPPGPAPQLPPQLAADIGRALNAAAAIAKEESESRLQQVRAELADLAENGESFEIQIDELTQALAARTSERDTLVGQLKEQASEVQELKATFEREQATAEALRLDCAKAQIKSETADSRVAEVLSREGELRSELAAVRNDLAAVQQARSEAERRADIAEAHLADANNTNARAENHFNEFRTAVKGLERTPERAAAAEASVTELRAQVAMLKELLAKALAPKPTGLATSGNVSGATLGEEVVVP